MNWKKYARKGTFDELVGSKGHPRRGAGTVLSYMESLTPEELEAHAAAANLEIVNQGITFTVYGEGSAIDRSWPLDIIPRIIRQSEWKGIEAGLIQRLKALNMFIDDVYHDQRIIEAGVFPREVLESSKKFLKEIQGINPVHNVWAHICGCDLVRDAKGRVYVLEDNLRIPSGVSYMIENRRVMKNTFPELFAENVIMPVGDYPAHLHAMLASLSPVKVKKPTIAVLTPGVYNSAYFEHSFLAHTMGAQLLEGRDLMVDKDDCVYMKTIAGPERVHVIYRRVDDEFIDPEVFRKDSVLGVPGLIRSWKAGKVALANAPGCGVADDKVVYAFVPKMIEFYLKQKPKLRNVPTYLCMYEKDLDHVLNNLDSLVVKPANESGGYGMLVGPKATPEERAKFKKIIRDNPRNYVAQPTLQLSTAPTIVKDSIAPRHLDLRPFILQGKKSYVTKGGLTRVALREGSLVVNSSQGGGSKDTWVIKDR